MESSGENYFSILGLDISIDITDAQLRKAYLECSKKSHPDMNPYFSRNEARDYSALINRAYQTLKDPISRAKYLLSLRGYPSDASPDNATLAVFLELNLEIEEAIQQKNSKKLTDLVLDIQENIEKNLSVVKAVLSGNLVPDYALATKKISEITYLLRMREKIATFATWKMPGWRNW